MFKYLSRKHPKRKNISKRNKRQIESTSKITPVTELSEAKVHQLNFDEFLKIKFGPDLARSVVENLQNSIWSSYKAEIWCLADFRPTESIGSGFERF